MSRAMRAYLDLLTTSGAWRFVLAAFGARMYRVATVIGTILLIVGSGADYAVAGAASAAAVVGSAVAAPAWSRAADRFGQAPVLLAVVPAMVAATAALVVAAGSRAPAPVILLAAFATGLATADAGALARARWLHLLEAPEERHRALALESTVDEIAFLVGLPVVTWASGEVAPAAGLLLGTGVAAVGFLALLGLRGTMPAAAAAAAAAADRAPRPGGLRAWMPRGVAPVLPAFLGVGAIFGFINLTGIAAADEAGQPGWAGLIITGFSVGSVLAALAWGAAMSGRSVRLRLVVATVAFVALVPTLLLARDLPGLGAAMVVAGVGMMPIMVSASAAIESRSPKSSITVAMSWPPVATSAGNAVAGIAVGAAIDGGGAYAAWAVPLLAAAAVVLSLVVEACAPRARSAQTEASSSSSTTSSSSS